MITLCVQRGRDTVLEVPCVTDTGNASLSDSAGATCPCPIANGVIVVKDVDLAALDTSSPLTFTCGTFTCPVEVW